MMVFSDFLNPVFFPLIDRIGIVWFVVILGLCLSLLITLIYKFATNQKEMKALKVEIKKLQEGLKKHKDNPKAMMESQRVAMQKNMQYMMHSMRAMLFTFLPLILIFGWMNAHLSYIPIYPGVEFTTSAVMEDGTAGDVKLHVGNIAFPNEPGRGVSILSPATQEISENTASWDLKAEAGEYFLIYEHENTNVTRYVLVTTEHRYKPISEPQKDGAFKSLNIQYEKLKLLNLFGWKIGWLGVYIIISLITSVIFRKLLKVY